jgi:hypothetical protein
MNVIIIISLMLTILAVWRRLHHRLAEKRFMYQMFALRDELRRLAICGEIDSRHWFFRYLDFSFSYAIRDAYYMTFFGIMLRGNRLKNDAQFQSFLQRADAAMEEHPELRSIMSKYNQTLHDYLKEQHYIGYTIFIRPLVGFFVGIKKARTQLAFAIKTTLYVPQQPSYPSLTHTALGI